MTTVCESGAEPSFAEWSVEKSRSSHKHAHTRKYVSTHLVVGGGVAPLPAAALRDVLLEPQALPPGLVRLVAVLVGLPQHTTTQHITSHRITSHHIKQQQQSL